MLKYKILETLPEAQDAGLDFTPIDDLVAWKQKPLFVKMGRTGSTPLEKPLHIETPRGPLTLHTLKVKGIGLCDHRGQVEPPTTREHYRIHPHLGFTPKGEFVPVLSKAAPLGGITLPMARAEYEIGRTLLRHGCPAQIPLRLYVFDEPHMVFDPPDAEPQPLAVVVSAVTTRSFVRANNIFNYALIDENTRGELDGWRQHLRIVGEPHRELALIREVGRRFARALRGFHEAGFYRYSGQPDNYAYCTATDEVFLIDLDSSRPLHECSEIEAPLQLLRDVASALYGVTAYMLRRIHVDRFSPLDVHRTGLYSSILSGYFRDLPRERLEMSSQALEDHFERIHYEARRRHEATPDTPPATSKDTSYAEYRQARRRQYWIYREETFSLFVVLLRDLLADSSIGVRHPLHSSREQMLESIARYAEDNTAAYISQRVASVREPALLAG